MKKKKGLTLLELVIVLGLMGIVTSLIFSFVNVTQRKSKELNIRQELQFEGTMITESMMKNVLEMKSISEIKGYKIGTDDGKIKSITFDLVGTKTYKGHKKVKSMEYRIGGKEKEKELKLFVYVEGQQNAIPVEVVSEYVKEMIIENKAVKDCIKNEENLKKDKFKEKLKKVLAKERSVNLKIVLEDDYYNKTIEHTHNIELSLRNANSR